ncbi:dihydroorotate dehydrogenase electron transfer subunit [Pectinatus sottacetonis]|uniref:dihydroorotate dehydrogenase electron transfer subunit n=1 Tax=Pectinatus sottacetonis TaxID=1002795 RepID=UPI001E4E4311|nr:dihydroorotate dehydrogenase electron transfer subunit [Pectinatus sottacetonis]
MKKFVLTGQVVNNKQISNGIYHMAVHAPQIAEAAQPGQFLHVKKPDGANFLRRPLGVADVDKSQGTVGIMYRILGKGTTEFSRMAAGDELSIVGPIGNGFVLKDGQPLIVGGGMGMAPLIYLADMLKDKKPIVLIGGRNKDEIFWQEYMKKFTDRIYVTTDDGSAGVKGFTTTLLPQLLQKNVVDDIYTCGPDIMMRGIAKIAYEYGKTCQVSLEKRMACGIGVCLGCTFPGKQSGRRRKVCTEGPVFPAEEVF